MTRRRWYDPFTGAPGGSDAEETPWHAHTDALVAIGSVAAGLVERRQWADRLEGSRIHDVWPEVAGPAVADHVVPLRLHGGVLVLQADSGAWATQIRYLSQQIMDRANEVLGAGKVSQVQITSVTRRR